MARASRTEWTKRVERWKDSGLSAREFAAETGINASSLNSWSWRLRAEERRGQEAPMEIADALTGASAAGFVELPMASVSRGVAHSSACSADQLELVLASGVRIRVPMGFDEATLKRVVDVLGSGR